MDNNNPSTNSGHGGNFFSGFLLGFLIGGFVVFLLATKKGKKLLKTISEEGMDNLSNILEKTGEAENLDEVYEEEEEAAPKRQVIPREDVGEKPKRFFKGVSSRRLN